MNGDLKRTEQQIDCATCPWNKLCIDPPVMTDEEVKAKIESEQMDKDKSKDDAERSVFTGLLSVLIFSGKDRDCRACPIFIERLREGPELSAKIKQIMKDV